jgi:MFS family permease
MVLAVFVIANDFVSLSVALPQIESEFDASISTIQWVINAYALVFGAVRVHRREAPGDRGGGRASEPLWALRWMIHAVFP